MRFHKVCGDRIKLFDDDLIAVRNVIEFDNGIVLSSEPLSDDVMFEVQIKGKVTNWTGGIEIGITTLDPVDIDLPTTASKLRNTAWIMSGSSVLKDGVKIIESYGPELDRLREGDTVGVLRSSLGDLIFFVNGRCLGIAVHNIPSKVFGVVDLYGQCVKARILNAPIKQPQRIDLKSTHNMVNAEMQSSSSSESGESVPNLLTLFTPTPTTPDIIIDNDQSFSLMMENNRINTSSIVLQDQLHFHPRCGALVHISEDQRSAERARPLDEYNNGVTMTHRPLFENELFEIRIDKVIDKWSGSIEVGVTTHNPETIRFPSTMTNMESGTIMMSGCKILVNGYAICTDYGYFNLDELKEGDRVGMMRRIDGRLYYYINGVNQGVAAENVEQLVWGVVDLYGMTVKVSIVDEIDDNIRSMPGYNPNNDLSHLLRPRRGDLSLSFHTLRDSNVVIVDDGKTAYRPHAFEHFNNGIVMTNRTLKTDEIFQVQIDFLASKWGGGIEIGVTELTCNDIHFSSRIGSLKTSTWAIIGGDVYKDGVVVIPGYVKSLELLEEGDTVGVMRKDLGILHFFVNGLDQGPAAFNVPEHVFGIIDLYGRVGQISMAENYIPRPSSPETPNPDCLNEMRFHAVCAPNGQLSRDRLTATRGNGFNYAVFFSSRPLRESEMFEIRIDKMYKTYGSLGFGVTAAKPDEIDVASVSLATVLPADTYVLSDNCLMKSITTDAKYAFDLNVISVGTRVGLMWHSDKNIHFYLDGMDQGPAFCVPNLDIYAVVDLYGACTQVTLLPLEERGTNFCTNGDISSKGSPWSYVSQPQPYCFSEYCGDNVLVLENYSIARRRCNADSGAALVFSAAHLVIGEIFEIKILRCKSPCAGSFRIGITDINILNAHVNRFLPPSISQLPHFTAYIDGRHIIYLNASLDAPPRTKLIVPSLEWIRPRDKIGFKKVNDGSIQIYYNSTLMASAFENVPERVYVVMELSGPVTSIQAISKLTNKEVTKMQPAAPEVTTEPVTDPVPSSPPTEPPEPPKQTSVEKVQRSYNAFSFFNQHGANITLCSSNTVAVRTTSFCKSLVVTKQRLRRGCTFMFRVDKICDSFHGTLAVGAVGSIRNLKFPLTAFGLKSLCWIITSDCKNVNGKVYYTKEAEGLNFIEEQSILSLFFDYDGSLYIMLDDKFRCQITQLPKMYKSVYPIIDIYGKITQVSIVFHKATIPGSSSFNLPTIVEHSEDRDDIEENVLIRTSFSEDDILLRANNNRVLDFSLPWSFTPVSSQILEQSPTQDCDTNMMDNSSVPDDKSEANEIFEAAVEQMVYLRRLLYFVNPTREQSTMLDDTWKVGAEKCSYMQNVYNYWLYLSSQFKELGIAMSTGTVKCFCMVCEPYCLYPESYWVRIEAAKGKQTMVSRESIYWHPMTEVMLEKVPYDDEPTKFAKRPDFYHTMPKVLPQKDPIIWTLEDVGVPMQVSVSFEINVGGIRDHLKAILINLHDQLHYVEE